MIRTLIGPVVLGLVVALLPGLLAPAQSIEPDPPLALSGSTPGLIESVRITVLPPDLDVGEGMQRLHPVAADVEIQGTTWQASVDPASIPRAYVRDNGVYDFLVEATGPERSYTTEMSARAISSPATSGAAWVDASDTAHLSKGVPSPPQRTTKPSATALVDAEAFHELEDDGVATGRYAASDAPCTYWGVTAVATRLRPTTIGTTYPLSGSTAWMRVSSSQGADYGVALRVSHGPATFTAAGDTFTRSGWSKTWEPSIANRAYRKEIEYTKYDYQCSDFFTHIYVWRPTGETGGTSSAYGLDRPDWNTCVPEAPGPWSRDKSTGESYKYGAAVKFAGIIGIDLSVDRNYSREQFITYHIRGQKRLCGNDGDYPAVAGKIMERFR